jgi:parvulin-like peptidyl-prolyl isomerase
MPVKKAVTTRKTRTSVKSTKIEQVVAPKSTGIYSLKAKLRQPKVFTGLIVVVVIIIAFLLKGLFVAALVNGEPITRFQVISELEKQGGKQALSSLVNQALILQEARKKNIQVSQKEVDAATKQIEDSLKGQGQDLDTALAAQGMTRKDLETQLKLRTLVEKLLADKIKVTDKEIADYIEKNKDTLPANATEAENKKSVEEQLKQQKLSTESSAWVEGLNKNAKVNYFVTY